MCAYAQLMYVLYAALINVFAFYVYTEYYLNVFLDEYVTAEQHQRVENDRYFDHIVGKYLWLRVPDGRAPCPLHPPSLCTTTLGCCFENLAEPYGHTCSATKRCNGFGERALFLITMNAFVVRFCASRKACRLFYLKHPRVSTYLQLSHALNMVFTVVAQP